MTPAERNAVLEEAALECDARWPATQDHIGDLVRGALEEAAAAEIARLRAENERTKALLARVTDDVARYNDEARKARADLAAAQEERDKLANEVARLREAMNRESDGAQYLANLLVEAEAALLSAAQQRGKAERERDAAQERERVLREALEEIDAVAADHGHYETAARTMHEIARAAMRGEP